MASTAALISCFDHRYKFSNYRHFLTCFLICDVQFRAVLTISYSTNIALKEQSLLNPNPSWKSQYNNTKGGLLKQALCQQEISVESNLSSLLYLCTDLNSLKQVHTHMFKTGLEQTISLNTKLVNMYAMNGDMDDARLVFDRICNPDLLLWNAIIRGYAKKGFPEEAIALYYEMQQRGMQPDNFTFPFVLKACSSLSLLREGKEIHNDVVKTGLESDVFVVTALIDMYAKCGSIEIARDLFDKMPERNVVTWNAIVAGYAQYGYANEAICLFNRMQLEDVEPDAITTVSVLQACSQSAALQQGISIHGYLVKCGLELDDFVGNSLLDMYAKCGCLDIAFQLFNKMSKRQVVSWNAMIVGYAQNGHAREALALFSQIRLVGLIPSSVTMSSALQACADLGFLKQGMCIHADVLKCGLESDVSVGNSLVAMYAKCDRAEVACQIFDDMPNRNVVSWSAMIAGYVQGGHPTEASALFRQMQLANVKPNSVTMVSVVPAYSYLAALLQGKCIHGYIIKTGFESDVAVGTALIDMYSKCGHLQIARQQFDQMPKRNVISWSAMIAGYGMHGHGEEALALFAQMKETGVNPNHITFVCILSACSHAGLLDKGRHFFMSMIQDYKITPRMEHYACMVDLLGRAGHLNEAQEFIEKMPLDPGATVWGALLGACRVHCDIELGKHAAEYLFYLEPDKAGSYVLLSNIYAASGRWDEGTKVRAKMKGKGVGKPPGCSLIEVNNNVYAFLSRDRSDLESVKVYTTLESFLGYSEEECYVPTTNFVLNDVEE